MVMYIKKMPIPFVINGHPVTYQADIATLAKQAHDNPFTYGSMWKRPDNTGGMWLNRRVLAQNVEDDGFNILQFRGMSNSGKSWLAFAKAYELLWILVEERKVDWIIYEDSVHIAGSDPKTWKIDYFATEKLFTEHIHVVHNWSEVLSKMDDAIPGDIIICDEETTISGQESITEANSMKNILKACRAKRINFFFIDPDPQPKPNIHAFIHVVGKIKDIWTTLSIIHDTNGTLVGLDFHVLPISDTIFCDELKSYEQKKMANIEALIAAHGRIGSNFASQQDKEAQVLYELAKERQKETGLRMTLKRLRVLMVDHNFTGGTGEYREQVTTRVMDLLAQDGNQFDDEPDEDGIIWSKESAGEEILPQDFHDQLRPFLYNWADKENINRDDVDLMLEWFQGASQEILSERCNISQREISRLFQDINQKILGYACEDWLATRNPNYIHVGGNSPGIDIETPDSIISVKATSKRSREFTVRDTSLAERERVLETGKEFLGFMFHVRHNRIRKIRWTEKQESENEDD